MLDQNKNNHYRQDEEGSDGAKQPLKTSDGFEKGDSDIAPEDRGNAVYLTFLLYGIGVLLPFNVILACLDFYGDKMPDYNCANIFPFVINGPQWLMQILLVVYGANISFSQRLVPGFGYCALSMLIVPITANVGGSTGFYLTSVALVFFGFACGACQGSIFAMAAAFPFKYMGAIMFGNGLSGIGCCLLRQMTLAIFPADEKSNNEFIGALSLFIFAFFVLAACVIAQLCLKKNKYANYYLKKGTGVSSEEDQTTLIVDQDELTAQGNVLQNTDQSSKSSTQDANKQSLSEFWAMAKKNLQSTDGLLYALIFVFITTFIVYPGITISCTLNFMTDIKNYDSWKIQLLQFEFNLLDTIGRYLGGVACLMLSHRNIKIGALLRIIFVATFFMITFDVSFFHQDWFIILNLFVFSISNGYISTLCAVKAPQTVEGEAKGQVGGFIGITISTGILIGSIIAFCLLPAINTAPESP